MISRMGSTAKVPLHSGLYAGILDQAVHPPHYPLFLKWLNRAGVAPQIQKQVNRLACQLLVTWDRGVPVGTGEAWRLVTMHRRVTVSSLRVMGIEAWLRDWWGIVACSLVVAASSVIVAPIVVMSVLRLGRLNLWRYVGRVPTIVAALDRGRSVSRAGMAVGVVRARVGRVVTISVVTG